MHCYGANTQAALQERYGDSFSQALEQQLLLPITTVHAECFFLSYKGRKLIGLAPNHLPPPWVAETHLYRRTVIDRLITEGYELQGWYSKSLLGFSKAQVPIVVAAKHDGYSAKGVRRIFRKLKQSAQLHPKLFIFTPYINRLAPLAQKHQHLDVIQHFYKS